MKRASFLKIVSVVMVVAMMLCNTIGVYADSVTASQNPADTTINVNGNIEGANPYEDSVIVIIFHKDVTAAQQASLMTALRNGTLDIAANIGTTILGIAQATVDSDGDYACDITLEDIEDNETGDYVVAAIPPSGEALEETVYFVPSADKLDILIDIITEANASDLQELIELNKAVFAFDANTMWDSIDETYQLAAASALATDNEIFAELREKISRVTLNNVDDVTLAIAQEIYAQIIANGLEDNSIPGSPRPLAELADMDEYADAEAYENAYENYCSEDAKDDVLDNILGNTSLSSFAKLFKEYKERIILGAVVKPKDDNGSNSRLALDALAETAGLDADSVTKYKGWITSGNSSKRQTVADACKDSNATTFAALNDAFKKAVKPGEGVNNNSNGGGGGSTVTVVQPTPTPSQKPIYERYNDINDHEWAWDAIEVLSDRNIVAGYENGSFAPENSILREEFIKLVVVGMFGAESIDASVVSSFTDAQAGWYAPYIAAAEKNNITSGIGNGLFGTGEQITRQDMALMLYRILRSANVYAPAETYAFTDADEIADYAAEAVYALKNMGIINGDPDGSFRPNGQTTRAEAAVLLYKTLNKLGKITY